MKYFIYGLNIFLILMIPVSIFSTSIEKESLSTSIGVKGLKKNNSDNTISINDIGEKSFRISDLDIQVPSAKISDVLEIQVGSLAAYGPDCPGCSGRLGSGQNALNGNIYYTDAKYGKIRIVAGDSKYPYGSIVRIVNSRMGEPFVAIVLDRGGGVGLGKRFTFDLLCATQKDAAAFASSHNVTFEILRYGY